MSKKGSTLLVLAAMTVLCSACTDKTTTASTATLITPTSQVAFKWEEAVAATTSARVNNTSLIFMR